MALSDDAIISMARDANPEHDLTSMLPFLSRFAALVAAKERKECAEHYIKIAREAIAFAKEEEREACAHVCESEWSNVADRMYGHECAAALRARKE